MPRLTPLAALLLVASACRGDDPGALARQAAQRDWCIAEELAVQSNAQIATMDTLGTGGNELIRAQLYPFAKAFHDFAKARERELALMDSALSAQAPEDSAAFAERAARARPHAPANRVEANAAQDYERRFAAALGNPAHPCHALEPAR